MQDSEQLELPLEPGLVPDTSLGVQGDFPDASEEENSAAEVEINDDEETEDDDG